MKSVNLKINNPHGVHLRVAAQVVKIARNSKSRIVLSKDGNYAEGDSILQLLILGAVKGSDIRVVAVGEDEQKIIQEMSSLFSDGGGI